MKYLNQTQKENIAEHIESVGQICGDTAWVVAGQSEVPLEYVRTQFNILRDKMHTIAGMIQAVENNDEEVPNPIQNQE